MSPAVTGLPADARSAARLLAQKVRGQGWSQRALAQRVGLSLSHLGQILRGHEGLKVKHLYAILDAMGLSPAVFFAELHRGAPSEGRHLVATLMVSAGNGLIAVDLLEFVREVVRDTVRETLAELKPLPREERRDARRLDPGPPQASAADLAHRAERHDAGRAAPSTPLPSPTLLNRNPGG
jgi:transcriptional regulator with XRE-family HTH domain